MREITHCPHCQTQFFVSEAQLNQHGGLVRCGQCLHVFNAKEQFVAATAPGSVNPDHAHLDNPNPDNTNLDSTPHLDNINVEDTPAGNAATGTAFVSDPAAAHTQSSWPTLDQDFSVDEATPAPLTEDSPLATPPTPLPYIHEQNQTVELRPPAPQEAAATIASDRSARAPETSPANDISKPSFIAGNQSHYVNDLAKHAKLDGRKIANNRHRWLWAIGAFLLLVIAVAQSVYFLRNTIAIYYPNLKPYLLQACQPLHCSVELPKQINWIIIDDSDMQEDLEHTGVMHLSSMLYNKAGFVQAYPNLELTLTDINDSAVLRRVFKPAEYLPANTDIAAGFRAGGEIRVKLAITTQDVGVAGYRLYVTY